MRGEASDNCNYDMSSTLLQGGGRSLTGYQKPIDMTIQSNSPEPACEFNSLTIKQETAGKARNDSGITSGSDSPSASPGSDRSENASLNSPPENNNLTPTKQESTPYPNSLEERNLAYDENSHSSSSPKLDSGDVNINEFDDKDITQPKFNSHGKIKVHKCKHCHFAANTRADFWNHLRIHFKADKILECPRCPFVTEVKHHLEYHLRNHFRLKPFKCEHCDYSCVNKSMLSSHLKSHSKVYQYRCADCLYKTKFCHSFKQHLRDNQHKPGMVLNSDGSPNPLPIIDVYGTRRGPKIQKQPNLHPETSSSQKVEHQPSQLPAINQLMINLPPQFPFQFPFVGDYPVPMPHPDLLLQKLVIERLNERTEQQSEEKMESGPLDLSKSVGGNFPHSEEGETTTMFSNVEAVVEEENEETEVSEAEMTMTSDSDCNSEDSFRNNNNRFAFSCQYCEICFDDEVLYRIHMVFHGYSDAFTCNICGEKCKDKVDFSLHIARAPH